MNKYVAEIIKNGDTVDLEVKQLIHGIWVKEERLSVAGFNSELEVEHFLMNIALYVDEKFTNVLRFGFSELPFDQHKELLEKLRAAGKALTIEELANDVAEECEPIIQIRKFHDGTFSVVARVYTPQKNFYEHPEFINLTEEEAKVKCQEVINSKITTSVIVGTWVHYAN